MRKSHADGKISRRQALGTVLAGASALAPRPARGAAEGPSKLLETAIPISLPSRVTSFALGTQSRCAERAKEFRFMALAMLIATGLAEKSRVAMALS